MGLTGTKLEECVLVDDISYLPAGLRVNLLRMGLRVQSIDTKVAELDAPRGRCPTNSASQP